MKELMSRYNTVTRHNSCRIIYMSSWPGNYAVKTVRVSKMLTRCVTRT